MKRIAGIYAERPRALPATIDWDALFIEFVLQEETPSLASFLRDIKGWEESRVRSGNTDRHTLGWGDKRAEHRRTITEEKMELANVAFAEILPLLKEAKRNIILSYLDDLKAHPDLKTRSHILNKIKTELGEPILINKQLSEDDGKHRDPALAVLIQLGVLNGTGGADTSRPTAAEATVTSSDGTAAKEPA